MLPMTGHSSFAPPMISHGSARSRPSIRAILRPCTCARALASAVIPGSGLPSSRRGTDALGGDDLTPSSSGGTFFLPHPEPGTHIHDRFILPLLALAFVGPHATAAAEEAWRVTVTPYAFLPVSTTGTSTVAGRSADLDLDLADIVETLNFAASARVEAWRGDVGVMVDGYYASIGKDAARSSAAGTASARVDVTSTQWWLSVMGGYRALAGTMGGDGRAYAVDLGAGIKINGIRQEIDAGIGTDLAPGTGVERSFGGTETFVEPAVSLRATVEVASNWTLATRADLSGFGVAGDDLQWLVLAGAEWRVSGLTSLRLGWQVYGIDFATRRADGRFAYDVVQTGPYLGLSFGF